MVFDRLSRRWYASKLQNSFVKTWLETPLPKKSSFFADAKLVAIDLETTGLDAKEGEIVSIGWVEIKAGQIDLKTARHFYIKPQASVGQSAVIHNIRDCDLDTAVDCYEILAELYSATQGALGVFHNKPLDQAFLNQVSLTHFKVPFLLPAIDTLAIEKNRFMRNQVPIMDGALRLGACRQRYNLPDYAAHNALVDALATAELLLAIVAKYGREYCRVGDLLKAV